MELERIRKEQKRMAAMLEAGLLTAEEAQRCHAVADRYDDLNAIRIIAEHDQAVNVTRALPKLNFRKRTAEIRRVGEG